MPMVSPLLNSTLAIGLPSGWEWFILLIIGLLVFGRRLPEVGRSLGRGIVEFKKGIRGIDDEIEEQSSRPAQRLSGSQQSHQELPKSASLSQETNPYASAEQRREQM